MSSLAALRALHATIGAALDDIDRVYNGQGLDYPSLDVPYYHHSATTGADPKQVQAEKLISDPAVARASSLIVAACGQLSASVQIPFLTLVEGAHLGHITAALSFLEETNTVEILREAGPQGLHVKDLARRINEVRYGKKAASSVGVAHLDPVKLSHILRLLATNHWLREVQPDVYSNGRLSSLLDSGKTPDQLSAAPTKKYEETNGLAAFASMTTKEIFRSVTYLPEWLLTSTDKAKVKKAETPFNLAYDTGEGYYEWLERPENAVELARVGRAMTAARAISSTHSIAHKAVFPWDALPEKAVVVDVGGGIGSVSMQLAEAYPHLRFVVQDREQTVAIAPKVWGATQKELFDSGRVSFQGQDFFEPQPATLVVPGVGALSQSPAVYVITRVLHNWPDAQCVKIMKNLRAAAGPDTRLLIHEIILLHACVDPSDAEDGAGQDEEVPTSSPLLPNLGKASSGVYQLDLTMMAMMDARERTLAELRALALEAGWRVEKVTRDRLPVTLGYLVAVPV
ncbi:S-adenosyl-L-methionine-dependent methyltransferase [Trametes cingulata]|nr:S-adenosyl-L-methionine-dependent methyltransferase [Trametes cingulata]